MSRGNSCSGGCGSDLGSSVGLADLAGDPDRHHLRGRHLGIATHPVSTPRRRMHSLESTGRKALRVILLLRVAVIAVWNLPSASLQVAHRAAKLSPGIYRQESGIYRQNRSYPLESTVRELIVESNNLQIASDGRFQIAF
jgi:hypothetical protein